MTSDNLSAGDMVVCIDASPAGNDGYDVGIREGATYRVGDVEPPFRCNHCRAKTSSLFLRGFGYSLCSARFRKIEPAEDCFVKAMRELRPLETAGEHTTT